VTKKKRKPSARAKELANWHGLTVSHVEELRAELGSWDAAAKFLGKLPASFDDWFTERRAEEPLRKELEALHHDYELIEHRIESEILPQAIIDDLVERYKDGRMPLMKALDLCLETEKICDDMCRWVLDGLSEAIDRVKEFEVSSWDEIFGKPHWGRKISHLRAEHERRDLVVNRFRELKRQRVKGNKLTILAKEFNISEGLAKKWCYPTKLSK
jgi:hypothetical protein